MTDLRQAAEMALEALVKVDQAFLDSEGNYGHIENEAYNAACDAQEPLRQALACSEPMREWVGLTDEEIAQVVGSPIDEVYLDDFRKVIAKLKEKNNE